MTAEEVKPEMEAEAEAEAKAEMEKLQDEMEKLQVEEEEEDEEDDDGEEPYSDYSHSAVSQEDNDSEDNNSEGDVSDSQDQNFVPIKIYIFDDEPEHYKTDEYNKFITAIEQSRGYDLPPRPDLKIGVDLVPCVDRTNTRKLSRVAIKKYNNRYETEYEFVRFIKGNKRGA